MNRMVADTLNSPTISNNFIQNEHPAQHNVTSSLPVDVENVRPSRKFLRFQSMKAFREKLAFYLIFKHQRIRLGIAQSYRQIIHISHQMIRRRNPFCKNLLKIVWPRVQKYKRLLRKKRSKQEIFKN